MGRGRPTQLKISEEEFRQLLLDKLVDEHGLKVSLRTLFSDEEFMKKTGYYNLTEYRKTGTYRMISPGTISYIVIEKLNLTSRELYYHHKFITKRVSQNTSYEQFMYSKEYKFSRKERDRNSMRIHNNLKDVPKDKLVWVLNSLSKNMPECPELDVCFANEHMSYDTLENYAERLRIFMGDDIEFVKVFRDRLQAFRQTYVDRNLD